ncbi:MAG: lysophospholipid acyltransferase family protein [Acidobacteria bacterium]|nr:lysophospholipid acyltransferase family protein [Acidobacteriota bacterium]
MEEKIRQVFRPADLSAYSLRERLTIRLAAGAFYLLIKAVGRTVKFETAGAKHLEDVRADGKTPIYAVWHDRIFLGTYYLRDRRIVVITSQSFDGEYIARFLTRFGFGTARGSSTRGGVGALVEMIRLVKRGFATAFTIDGPKGPRYVAKSGACLLAKKTGQPILPFLVEAERFTTVGSWDKLQIPKPFTRAKFFYGEPFYVPADASDDELEEKRAELQSRLDELVELGKQWRESIK